MSNPVPVQDDDSNPVVSNPVVSNPVVAQAVAGSTVGGPKPAKKDTAESVAGEATGGIDIEALALKVYALLKQEVRIERERSVRS